MNLKNNKWLKAALLILALAAFVIYFLQNQSQFSRLNNLTWWQVLLIILGQLIVFLSNILVSIIFIKLVGKKLHFIDSARLTAYSSLINFFGFLQGGLGLRGVYFKRQFDMPFKKYLALTVVQYVFLFAIAGFMIIFGVAMTSNIIGALTFIGGCIVLALTAVAALSRLAVFKKVRAKLAQSLILIRSNLSVALLFVLILQLVGSFLTSFVELQAIGAHISLGGLLVYSGTSQFAIIIALTPGAIGIREALLLIVQQQMHLTTEDIVLAATIDRVVYFITLALIAPLALNIKKYTTKKAPEVSGK